MVKFKDFSRPLSVFQVLFEANLVFKDFSRQSCIFKYFSSLCQPCETQHSWVKVQNSLNPELFENQILKLAVCLQISTILKFNGQLSLDKLKINQRSY